MWSNLIYMAPVINILYNCIASEEIKMEGNVGDELTRVFKKYLVNSRLRLGKMKIHANIYEIYPAGINLWSILDDAMRRFHLDAAIEERQDGVVILKLEEGVSWKH